MLAGLLVLALVALSTRFLALKRVYYIGIATWSRWLPVIATGIYLAVLAVNLATGAAAGTAASLGGFFAVPELIGLFLVGPLFLTRAGNLAALATVAYLAERLLLGERLPGEHAGAVAIYFLSGAATVVAVLADKMPWLAVQGPNHLAQKLRELSLVGMTVLALAACFMGLVKVHPMNHWIVRTFGVSLGAPLVMALLIVLFLGWMSVAMGVTRNLTIPVLLLPTLFVVAFITDAPTHLLVVPFALCFALSLSTADRRTHGTRRTMFDGMFHARLF